MPTYANPAQRRLDRALRSYGTTLPTQTTAGRRNARRNPLYSQNRGSNGRFDGSGFTARTTAGGRNPLFYYDSGETRRVTDENGRVIEPGGRRTNSAGERAINNAIRTAAMRGANRNPAMRTRSRSLR